MSHSYIKNTPDVGKKTALKLLNKYADNFNSLKEENALLKLQIQDLNSNLKINKSIIDGFFSKLNPKEKESSMISNIKQENYNLYNQIELLQKKNSELSQKLQINQQNFIEATMKIREDNERFKTKIFMLEQVLEKKENLLNKSKKKIYKNNFFNQKEIYVTNPSKLINEINNELIIYKEKSKKNEQIIKDTRLVVDKYEDQIMELQEENQLLRQEYRMHIFSTNKERETLMTEIQKERIQLRSVTEDKTKYRNNKKNNGNDVYDIDNKIKINKSSKNSNKKSLKNNLKIVNDNMKEKDKDKGKLEKIKDIITTHGKYLFTDPNRLKKNEDLRKKNFIYGENDIEKFNDNYFLKEIEDKQYEHEEFIDIVKSVGLTLEKYEELRKIKYFSEFTEIIEMLLNLNKEKENIINILQRENENLNANNFKLNKDNMFLFSQNINLKKQLAELNDAINNNQKNETSLIPMNNLNEINLNPKIKSSMHNYKEYINQKQKKLPTDNILNIQRIIIDSSIDKYSTTLKQKFEKEQKKAILEKNKINNKELIPNGLTLTTDKDNKVQKINNDNLFVKPILETNEEQIKDNSFIDKEKDDNNNIKINDIKNINNKKIENNILNQNTINNKNMGTIISVTSSEFRKGCRGLESFMSTIKFN
jgi:hypothetical protein